MHGIAFFAVLAVLLGLAGYVIRPTSKTAAQVLYGVAAVLALLLLLGLTRLA